MAGTSPTITKSESCSRAAAQKTSRISSAFSVKRRVIRSQRQEKSPGKMPGLSIFAVPVAQYLATTGELKR
jgi:hypothetical protein